MRGRRGWTVVEALVAALLGAMVLGAAWDMVGAALRSGARTEDRLAGVEAALLASVALERDLRGLHEDRAHLLEVERGDDLTVVSFWRYAGAEPADAFGPLPLERVTWRLCPSRRRVTRRAGDGPERAVLGAVAALTVRAVAAPGGRPGPACAVAFTCVGTPAGSRAPSDRRPATSTAVAGAVPVPRGGSRAAYPFWNEIPYAPGA